MRGPPVPIIRTTVRVLVTGASGCIGTALIEGLLLRGHEVTAVDIAPVPPAVSRPVEFVNASYGAVDVPAGTGAVVHLACSSVPATSAASLEVDVAENVLPSVELFGSAARAGVRRIVFASSGGTVYGDLPAERAAWTEDDATRPVTAHGAMKLTIETYLRTTTRGSDASPVVARIGNAYGRRGPARPGHGAVDHFVRAVLRGDAIEIWGDGSAVRDYVHVTDIAGALAAMVEAERPSPVFNVGSGSGTSLAALVPLVEAACGAKANVRHRLARGVDLSRNVLDASRAQRELGWAPRLGLAEGIARTVAEVRA